MVVNRSLRHDTNCRGGDTLHNIISSKILHFYHPREMLCHIDSRIVELPLPWYKYLLSVALLAPPIALLKCTPVWQCGWCISL